MTLQDYINSIIGRPWDKCDWACWDLVRGVQKHFGHDLPLIPGMLAESSKMLVKTFQTHVERKNWEECGPEHGAIALMGRNDGGRGREIHAGVRLILDRPFICHVDVPHGTVLDTVAQINTRGWHTINYYRHV